jgi:hypothetical protein
LTGLAAKWRPRTTTEVEGFQSVHFGPIQISDALLGLLEYTGLPLGYWTEKIYIKAAVG